MNLIKEIYHNDIGIADAGGKIKYELRKAARAVLVNEHNQIALLYVAKDGYYKLPGGGIEKNESITDGLIREIYEEVGSKMIIKDPIGMTIEYREQFEQLQISYSYLCKTCGELAAPDYTQNEREHGFQLVWKNIDAAISDIASYGGDKYVAKFICYRDLHILKAALPLLKDGLE